MDPPNTASHFSSNLSSPGGSRITLPQVVGAAMNAANIGGENVFSGFPSPPLSGPSTGSSLTDAKGGDQRQVFSDFRRFVSFGLRKEPSINS